MPNSVNPSAVKIGSKVVGGASVGGVVLAAILHLLNSMGEVKTVNATQDVRINHIEKAVTKLEDKISEEAKTTRRAIREIGR